MFYLGGRKCTAAGLNRDLAMVTPVSDRNYLYFQAEKSGASVSLKAPTSFNISLQYSTDGTNWTTWTSSVVNGYDVFTPIEFSERGESMFIRANGTNTWTATESSYMQFVLGDRGIACGGNIMSLLDQTISVSTLPSSYAFKNLFYKCVGLTSAPELTVTVLTPNCYDSMFAACVKLKEFPNLPATNLADGCYANMFSNCTSAVSGVDLSHVMTVGSGSCCNMYAFCSSLSEAYTPVFVEWNSNNFTNWLNNVAYSGTMHKPLTANMPVGVSGIPHGWVASAYGFKVVSFSIKDSICSPFSYTINGVTKNVSDSDNFLEVFEDDTEVSITTDGQDYYVFNNYEIIGKGPSQTLSTSDLYDGMNICCRFIDSSADFLCFNGYTYSTSGTIRINITHTGSNQTTRKPNLYYSIDDKQTWHNITDGFSIPNSGSRKCYVFGFNKGAFSTSDSDRTMFRHASAADRFGISGNVNTLITPNEEIQTIPYSYYFNGLFSQMPGLVTANITLPATTLKSYCYKNMFWDCNNLITGPETLPATALVNDCYSGMFYSCGSLATAPALPATTLAKNCYYYMFYQCRSLTAIPTLPAETLAESCYFYMFYNCSSLRVQPSLPATTLADHCYRGMFQGCNVLPTAPALPATTLANSCYYEMFRGCTNLTTAPALPATTLADSCYYQMFWDCTSLTTAPALPATTLQNSCYRGMFNGCSSLTTPPTLSATTLAYMCCNYMFGRCTSLTTAPALPATTLADHCYQGMFSGCTSLTTPPVLPATTLANACYGDMFGGCTSLTTAPALPATTLQGSCYSNMFKGCTNLVSPPVLPATKLESACYWEMFSGCTSLTTPPALPATRLASQCYQYMFSGCTSLTTPPALPATRLPVSYGKCYSYMFSDCTSLTNGVDLQNITSVETDCFTYMYYNCTNMTTVYAPTISEWNTGYFSSWVLGVSETGTMYKSQSLDIPTGVNGIPTGWTTAAPTKRVTLSAENGTGFTYTFNGVTNTLAPGNSTTVTVTDPQDITISTANGNKLLFIESELYAVNANPIPYADLPIIGTVSCTPFSSNDTLCFTANTANSVLGMTHSGTNQTRTKPKLYISTDNKTTWSAWEGESITLPSAGYAVHVVGVNKNGLTSETTNNLSCFTMSGSISVSGNIMALIDATGSADSIGEYGFYSLFQDCTSLTTAPELPATTLASNCYACMFRGCTSLTTAPALPATTLAYQCYAQMFQGCTSLTTAPALPATTLGGFCYYCMFQDCTSLTTAPAVLPAAVVDNYSYNSMFHTCTSLTTPPVIMATEVSNYGCGYMFYGCSSLTTPPALPATVLGDSCYSRTFSMCSALTAAPELPATTLADSCYSNMFYHCINITTPPSTLPATVLKPSCYYSMFEGCSSLTSAPLLPASSILIDHCYYRMFYSCTKLGYIKCLADIWNTTNTNYWVANVKSSGTFVKKSGVTIGGGVHGIPIGWTVKNNAFYVSQQNNTVTVTCEGLDANTGYYTINGGSHVSLSDGTTTIPITQSMDGQTFYMYGEFDGDQEEKTMVLEWTD